KTGWPSGSDVEHWFESGASPGSDVGLRLRALLEGHDLDPSMLLLGAVLRIPTFRRDLQFDFWLAMPDASEGHPNNTKPSSPTGRTLAGWLPGWSFVARPSGLTTVHFVGSLVKYPNAELELIPTNQWKERWGWTFDRSNCLAFHAKDGGVAAWYERWLGHD